MTSLAGPDGRRLAAFSVASEPGNERVALARVAEAVAASGLPRPAWKSSRPPWPRQP